MNDKINFQSAQYILGSVGTLGGLYYAFSNKKGALAYVGFALLGGIAGSILGGLYDNAIKPAAKNVATTIKEVKDDLLPLQTTRPMQPSPVSTESEEMDAQMRNFL